MRRPFPALITLLIASLGLLHAAELKVATLHPLLSDLAHQVGGERVEIVDLTRKNTDPHHFEPTPQQLREAGDAQLFLASGMGLENFLPALRSMLPSDSKLIEIGATLPSIEGKCHHPEHQHSDHAHNIDPHWWHSIDAFRRATTVTAEAFAEADPAGAQIYRANALAYRQELNILEGWARREIARIPRSKRSLATAHAAFGYFCKDFGFEALPIQGINREQMPDAQSIASLIARLRDKHITVIFPENASNPKILAALTEDTAIQLAPALIADGSGTASYEAMFRHNVTTIVSALK